MIVVTQVPAQVEQEFSHCLKRASVDAVSLERMKEGLHMCILPRGATPSHALTCLRVAEVLPDPGAEELTAPVTMEDQTGRWLPTTQCGREYGARQSRISHLAQAPRQDAA